MRHRGRRARFCERIAANARFPAPRPSLAQLKRQASELRKAYGQSIFNRRSGTVIAVALTSQSQRAGFPLTLELESSKLPKRTWAKISQIRTLAVERIGKKIGQANPEETAQVVEGLNEIIEG